jgi:hypothetical protein
VAIARADDGFRLWYEASGDGPAIIFPARFRAEQATLGAALAGNHRVIRYKPRQCVGVMEDDSDSGGPLDWTSWTRYPLDMDLGDLHAVADAAGAGSFVLAGYSGMAALAGFLVAASGRAAGLMIGGFPLLAGYDYWLGYVEGARAALAQAGLQAKADEQHIGVLLYREWARRDDRAALAALPGPKILWYGNRDGEPDCRMYEAVGGGAIARRIAAQADDLRRTGFTLIELDGYDHIGALTATEVIAPRLTAALASAGW